MLWLRKWKKSYYFYEKKKHFSDDGRCHYNFLLQEQENLRDWLKLFTRTWAVGDNYQRLEKRVREVMKKKVWPILSAIECGSQSPSHRYADIPWRTSRGMWIERVGRPLWQSRENYRTGVEWWRGSLYWHTDVR